MRAAVFALLLWCGASSAFALEAKDVTGAWVTEWSNSADEPISDGAPMRIALDSESALDGVWPSPGPDGTIYGEAETQDDGSLVWIGTWANVWPEGVTRGTFRFVFTDADNFTGTWSTDDGDVAGAAWNGHRAPR